MKIQQDTGSPTMWGDACCVMLSGTFGNVVKAQQMILERIANTSDRLKEMVSQSGRSEVYTLVGFSLNLLLCRAVRAQLRQPPVHGSVPYFVLKVHELLTHLAVSIGPACRRLSGAQRRERP